MTAVAISGAAGMYVLRPFDRAAKKNKLPTRFTVADFLALIAHLSVPLALFATFSRGGGGAHGSEIVIAVDGRCIVIAGATSRLGETQPPGFGLFETGEGGIMPIIWLLGADHAAARLFLGIYRGD